MGIEHVPSSYIVIRPAPDLPKDYLPVGLDGQWHVRASSFPSQRQSMCIFAQGVAYATGLFELRMEDGEFAEVYEVRP